MVNKIRPAEDSDCGKGALIGKISIDIGSINYIVFFYLLTKNNIAVFVMRNLEKATYGPTALSSNDINFTAGRDKSFFKRLTTQKRLLIIESIENYEGLQQIVDKTFPNTNYKDWTPSSNFDSYTKTLESL